MYTQSALARSVFLGCGNREPALDDIIAEPIVQLLMSSDRVAPSDLQWLLTEAKRQRAA